MNFSKFFKKFLKVKVCFFKKFLSDNFLKVYPKLNQPCLFLGKGEIIIDKSAHLGYFPSPLFYSTYCHLEARNPSSKIIIGKDVFINNNACIISNGAKIEIGQNCRIGMNFQCFDSDFHGLKAENRDNSEAIINKDTTIGNNVFIGNNVIILKGVTVGEGCVIAAGAVVTKSFPEKSIIAGNPAIAKGEVK
ncbi:MAG TPA: acyltransferase [Candidatus Gastranaerophilaceae bacterium]|nr:acyltransferase [Candidatus Gastranaerophilaceae bacterium]